MSIFTDTHFLANKSLDFENKFYQPTLQLAIQIQNQINSIYHDIQQALTTWHGVLAVEAQRMYEVPGVTASEWYARMTGYGHVIYDTFTKELLPKAESVYEQEVAELGLLGQQLQEFWLAFYDDPETIATQWLEPIAVNLNAAFNISQGYLLGMYSALIDLFNLLLEQPGATLTAVYQNTINALLNGYFELISTLLN